MPEESRQRPPRNKLDHGALRWWRLQLLVLVGPLVVALAVLGAVIAPARSWLLALAAAGAVLGGLVVLLLPMWWYRVNRWEVTDTAVYARTGFFWRSWRAVPLSRIQTVDTVRGPLQKACKLASVTVTTASAQGAMKIEGLGEDLAATLVEQLTETAGATRGGAA